MDNKLDNPEFKDILKRLRESKHISQAKLADDLKLSAGTIGMYETGKRMPSFKMLEILADYFNVDINYLTGWDNTNIVIISPDLVDTVVALYDHADNTKALLKAFVKLNDKEQKYIVSQVENLVEYLKK